MFPHSEPHICMTRCKQAALKVHCNVYNEVWVQEKVPKVGGTIAQFHILQMLVFTTF